MIHDVTYDHFSTEDAGLGHQALREIYATHANRGCYMFEEAIHMVSVDNAKPLSAEQLKQLRQDLDSVMQNVQIENNH